MPDSLSAAPGSKLMVKRPIRRGQSRLTDFGGATWEAEIRRDFVMPEPLFLLKVATASAMVPCCARCALAKKHA